MSSAGCRRGPWGWADCGMGQLGPVRFRPPAGALCPAWSECAGRGAGAGDGETARQAILAMEGFFRSIDMPTSLRELGVNPTPAQLEEMADKCALAVGGYRRQRAEAEPG